MLGVGTSGGDSVPNPHLLQSPVYRCVGVCRAGFGGAGGSVGDTWISGGSTSLQGLCAISLLISRSLMQAASVSAQS
jgi:hypothetical protein